MICVGAVTRRARRQIRLLLQSSHLSPRPNSGHLQTRPPRQAHLCRFDEAVFIRTDCRRSRGWAQTLQHAISRSALHVVVLGVVLVWSSWAQGCQALAMADADEVVRVDFVHRPRITPAEEMRAFGGAARAPAGSRDLGQVAGDLPAGHDGARAPLRVARGQRCRRCRRPSFPSLPSAGLAQAYG